LHNGDRSGDRTGDRSGDRLLVYSLQAIVAATIAATIASCKHAISGLKFYTARAMFILGWVNISRVNFFISGPKFTKFLSSNALLLVTLISACSHLDPFQGYSRLKSIKLSEIARTVDFR